MNFKFSTQVHIILTQWASAALSPTEVDQIVHVAVRDLTKEKEAYKQTLERAKKYHHQFASNSSSSNSKFGNSDSIPGMDLEVLDFLGRGAEGEVHKVRLYGQILACKQIQIVGRHSSASRTVEHIENEVAIMRKLRHQHIILVTLYTERLGTHSIFMEPCADMNLGVYLDSCAESGYVAELLRSMAPWFGCLVDALAFAHQSKIAHRDIKPSNILIKGDAVFLADFGEARDFSQHETMGTANVSVCGTPVYRAPEVTPGHPRGLPADIFSLGCVFSEMLTVMSRKSLKDYQEWRRVFNSDTPLAFRANLKKVREWVGKLDDDSELEALSSLIKPMIREDPKQRPTAQQLWKSLVGISENSDKKFYCNSHYP